MKNPVKACAIFTAILLCSCSSTSSDLRIDSFVKLQNVKSQREVTLSGYLFTGLESSGLYRFDDVKRSGKQCVRMNYSQVKKLKVGENKVVVKGIVRQSNECSSGKLICLHACKDHYFESFTIVKI